MILRENAESIARMLSPQHLQVLEVCLDFPTSGDGAFCGEWILHRCQEQGIPFHQGWLTKLANVGLLKKDDASRGGHRRYYRIGNAELIREVLALQPA